MEFAEMGKSTTALIDAVVQTNLQAMQELLRAENPEAILELQQRFTLDYLTVLMRSTMALVDAVKSTAAGATSVPRQRASNPDRASVTQDQAANRAVSRRI